MLRKPDTKSLKPAPDRLVAAPVDRVDVDGWSQTGHPYPVEGVTAGMRAITVAVTERTASVLTQAPIYLEISGVIYQKYGFIGEEMAIFYSLFPRS